MTAAAGQMTPKLVGALDDIDCLRLSEDRKRELEDEAGVRHVSKKAPRAG